MPSNDNRQIFRGIAVRVPAGPKAGKVAGKKVKFAQRTLTEADNFDEIECFLTPEEVERLQEPDPYTGLPVLAGDWTGKATRHEETGEVVPAEYSPPDDEGKPRRARRAHKKADEE